MNKNILFVCTVNKLRSKTAEEIFRSANGFNVKSAGTDPSASVPISEELISWADTIFVMEKSHKNRVQKKFKKSSSGKRIIVLDIPDDYEFMDSGLISLLKTKLGNFFGERH